MTDSIAPLLPPGGPVRRRLVVFPHAGAGPSGYHPLVATGLPDDTEVLGVTLPGREHRMDEPYATDFHQVIRSLAKELSALDAMPTVFFGHSFGTQLAAALASTCPGLCTAAVLSSHPPPAHFRRPGVGDALTPTTLLAAGHTPADVLDDPELRGWLLALLSADLDLNLQGARLLRDAELHIPVLALTGTDDPLATPSTLNGWQQHARAGFRTRVLPGDHLYLFQPPAAAQVRTELRALLNM